MIKRYTNLRIFYFTMDGGFHSQSDHGCVRTLRKLLLRPRERWWGTAMSTSLSVCVCVSVCLSASISPEPHARSVIQFFCACCPWPWLGPPLTGWCNPKGKGQFWGLSGPFKSISNPLQPSLPLSLQKDHWIANNVMHQKWSFSMPGMRE